MFCFEPVKMWKLVVFVFLVTETCGFRGVFDQELQQNALDEELCQEQLTFLSNHSLLLNFLDSSGKLPSGILSGNVNDLGDYHQCLSIDENVEGTQHHIQGKYCTVYLPLNQSPIPEWPDITWQENWPNVTWPENWPNDTWPENLPDNLPENLPDNLPENFPDNLPDNLPENWFENWLENPELKRHLTESVSLQYWAQTMAGVGTVQEPEMRNDQSHSRIFPIVSTVLIGPKVAVCVPKVCTARQALNFFQGQNLILNVTFTEGFCRLNNDKPLAAADYVAVAIFSLIGLLTIVSTSTDLFFKFFRKRPLPNLVTSFSVYTNTRRFLSFNSPPDALHCVDGIRAISMMWVVVGHTYSLTLLGFVHNINEALAGLRLFSATWVNSAPLTVDTFFLLSGILAVYSTVGKISRARFIRTVHLFYINRLLRMFPLLAAVILLQASLFHHVSDGPFWQNVAQATENCRNYWWAALLHIQNYVQPLEICLAHTWYLSVDTQLYFVCPIVIVWLFGRKRFAWSSLCLMLLLSLVSTSIYSFTYNFTAALVQPNRILEFADYLQTYYINTLTRAPPFFIGMIYGYILHLYRGRKIRIPKMNVAALWVLSLILTSFCVFSIYPVMQLDHDAQTLDNFLNAYMRTFWAIGLGWIIFACTHGYGGPVNWFLSLSMWKLPARLSYAMYLIHLPIIMIANSSWVKTHYFTNGENIYRFSGDLFLTFVAAFILCIFIDAPFSTLQKELLGGKKKPANNQTKESQGRSGANEKTTL